MRRDLLNQLTEAKGNIRVLARVRPLHSGEDASSLDCSDEWTIHAPLSSLPPAPSQTTPALTSSLSAPSLSSMLASGGSSTQSASNHSQASSASSLLNKKYQFDRVFGPEASQKDVFEEVETLSTSLLDGYNCCLFAYGQTGSGKTFTMEGPTQDRGLNYRLLQNVFSEIQERSATTHYDLNVSIMEIYNEAIVDLLDEKNIGASMASINASSTGAGLKMRQGERGIFVPDATRIKVNTIEQVEQVMETGKRVRAVASTDMNEHSSRSHCITCIEVCGRKSGGSSTAANGAKTAETSKLSHSGSASLTQSKSAHDGESGVDVITWSRLFLIDLAGSERVAQSGAQGKALDEARHINKSLSALARVMECLQMKRQHIPFRDSTLTYLLKDSLVEAKTVMVLNLSPAAVSYAQSINSLNFGTRVRKIERAAPKKNFDLDRDRYNAKNVEMESELKTLRADVSRLTAQLNQVKVDSQAEIQAIQSKHMEVVAQLRLQATQTAQAHSAEIATLLANHAQEVAALKKSLADANANAAKLAEIQKRALAASTQNAKPTPAVVASAIIAQQMPPQQSLSALTQSMGPQRPSVASKENLASALNEMPLTYQLKSGLSFDDSRRGDDMASKNSNKYMHSSTPLKPKSVTSIISTAPIPVTPKSKPPAYASPSKLSSPKVVVDELQRMYLQQLSQITSPAMTGPIVGPPSEIPMMGANGILQPVVLLTPQLVRNKPLTIANASSPLPFDMGPSATSITAAPLDSISQPNTNTSVHNHTSTNESPATVTIVLETVAPAPSNLCILDDDSYLTQKSAQTTSKSAELESKVDLTTVAAPQIPEQITALAAPIAPLPTTETSVISNSSSNSIITTVSAIAPVTSTTTLSTSIASGKTWPHRGCLLNKHAIGRVKKNVSFSERDEFFDGGDPLMPIRRPTGVLAAPKPLSSASLTTSTGLVSRAPTVSPASPIKSGVIVRPPMASTNPGARRVVAKSSTTNTSTGFSSSAPKPTPGRVRPVGRVGQPLAGPTTVYKTY